MIEDVLPPKRSKPKGEQSPAAKTKTEEPATVIDEPIADEPVSSTEPSVDNLNIEPPTVPHNNPPKLRFWHDRKKLIIVASAGVGLLLVLGVGGYLIFHKNESPKTAVPAQKAIVKKAEPKPTIITSPLTGLPVTEAQSKRPVTGIMIENSPDGRPQSGLRDAGVVYEAIAEGGITRFLTLFQENAPGYIGPVRSVRPYYLDFLAPFDASIAHVGGSFDALQQVRGGMKDLDQFFNSGTYSRIPSRYAPHNVYTDFTRLDALNVKKGYVSSKFTSWPRKAEAPSKTPSAGSIDFNISGYYYNVHYAYDSVTNSYLRSEAGKPHVDIVSAADKAPVQLHPKVVMALVMPYTYGPADDGTRSTYGTTGSGKLFLYQDGIYYSGTWNKADRNSQFVFKDDTGKVISLNAGQTWITIVSSAGNVAAKP